MMRRRRSRGPAREPLERYAARHQTLSAEDERNVNPLARLHREKLPEGMPRALRPALEADLGEREAGAGSRLDHDPRQDERVAPLRQVGRGTHEAVTGEILPRLLQHVDEGVRRRHACGVVAVLQVTRADVTAVLLEDRLEEANPLVSAPDRRGGILAEDDRDGTIR